MELYRIEALNFSYPLQSGPALKDINLSIETGDFVVLSGISGCGKTTLLRMLKTAISPHGARQGAVYFKNQALKTVALRKQAEDIGFVLQSPDNQIVTDKVWHEMAFGLENLGYPSSVIRLRVAEMASFFGIQNWFHKSVAELSGGQKQVLNLAAVMAMHPSVLILDEPTAQLDPIAASEFINALSKVNQELGTTVILSEHRLEELIPKADKLVMMEKGRILSVGTPKEIGEQLYSHPVATTQAMTTPMQVYAQVKCTQECPISIKEGRLWLENRVSGRDFSNKKAVEHKIQAPKPWIKLENIWFKYSQDGADVVKGLNLEIYKNQINCIVGGNGTGKTTALSILGEVLKPYRGRQEYHKKDKKPRMAMLPQNPQTLFVHSTVEKELNEMVPPSGDFKEWKLKVEKVVEQLGLTSVLKQHPYDLSGGEQQKAALAKIVLLDPDLILLDEPTKGLDNYFKEQLGQWMKHLMKLGKTIVMVSHDVEFCARYGDVCGLFFDGQVISHGEARSFFAGNQFYTTAANRMAQHIEHNAVVIEDVIALCNAPK